MREFQAKIAETFDYGGYEQVPKLMRFIESFNELVRLKGRGTANREKTSLTELSGSEPSGGVNRSAAPQSDKSKESGRGFSK